MAVGVTASALAGAVQSIGGGRKAIMGARMAEMPTVQGNLGEATSLVTAARLTVAGAMNEVDDRLAGGGPGAIPTEADHQRQIAASVVVLRLCDEAMRVLARTLGGNALRESGAFERHRRDLAGMVVHINAHPDRVHPRVGQLLLDVPANRF
jgi:alkylation response protein AidB-like acyl-CoA dehydrogenase